MEIKANSDMGGIQHLVRVAKGECLSATNEVAKQYAYTPEVAEIVVCCGRSPFPSIEGNPPLDKKRPYLDLRRLGKEKQ